MLPKFIISGLEIWMLASNRRWALGGEKRVLLQLRIQIEFLNMHREGFLCPLMNGNIFYCYIVQSDMTQSMLHTNLELSKQGFSNRLLKYLFSNTQLVEYSTAAKILPFLPPTWPLSSPVHIHTSWKLSLIHPHPACSGMGRVCQWQAWGTAGHLHLQFWTAWQWYPIFNATAALMTADHEIHCCKDSIGLGC